MRQLLAGVAPILIWLVLAPPSSAQSGHRLLRATLISPIVQNRRADAEGLTRVRDRTMIRKFGETGQLVRVPGNAAHYYTKYVTPDFSYLRPWSKRFLDELAKAYYTRFKKKLRVTSMVRTASLQKRVAKRNGNAAAAYGPRRSSHLTGATMDISKHAMSAAEIAWMRKTLHRYKVQGFCYAIEEFRQPTFHIMVHKKYSQDVEARTKPVTRRKSEG